jgi:hypothetical protein
MSYLCFKNSKPNILNHGKLITTKLYILKIPFQCYKEILKWILGSIMLHTKMSHHLVALKCRMHLTKCFIHFIKCHMHLTKCHMHFIKCHNFDTMEEHFS